MRANATTRRIPVLLMWAAASDWHVAEARTLGVERIISVDDLAINRRAFRRPTFADITG
jgi:hypothetical protein